MAKDQFDPWQRDQLAPWQRTNLTHGKGPTCPMAKDQFDPWQRDQLAPWQRDQLAPWQRDQLAQWQRDQPGPTQAYLFLETTVTTVTGQSKSVTPQQNLILRLCSQLSLSDSYHLLPLKPDPNKISTKFTINDQSHFFCTHLTSLQHVGPRFPVQEGRSSCDLAMWPKWLKTAKASNKSRWSDLPRGPTSPSLPYYVIACIPYVNKRKWCTLCACICIYNHHHMYVNKRVELAQWELVL